MTELGIDIETYSSEDLASCGVYRYAEAPDFAVLLFAYSVDGGTVRCVDIACGEELPPEVLSALTDPAVTKTAFNAQFERTCLSRWLGRRLEPEQWQCTMVAAARMGFPLSLAQCAEVLHLEQGKMTEGRALIRLFSKPGRDGKRRMEQAVLAKVRRLGVTPMERRLYIADQRINDRGVLIDRRMVENAARMDDEYKQSLLEEAKRMTGLENPNSVSQLKGWLEGQGRRVARVFCTEDWRKLTLELQGMFVFTTFWSAQSMAMKKRLSTTGSILTGLRAE